MEKRTSKKEIGFAKDFLETGNGVKSALKNYDTDNYNSAGVIAHQNLKKAKIQLLIQGFAEKAEKNIQELANKAEKEEVRLKANIDQLDRAGHKAVEKTMNVNLEIQASPEIKELTKKLNEFYGGTSFRSDGGKPGSVGDKAQDKE